MSESKNKTATLGGSVWNDVNHDGLQNDGNIGIAGIKVQLMYLDNNGRGITKTTVTDANGNYSFSGLKQGEYIVKFDKTTLPEGATFSSKDIGKDNSLDSDINPNNGQTDIIRLKPGQILNSVDAGVNLPVQNDTATVNGHVWNDSNNNGLQDAGEGALGQGLAIDLYSVDANGQVDSRAFYQTIVDANGNYTFTDVAPGQYIERFGGPNGYGFTQFNQGNNEALDSDINPVTGDTEVFTLSAGQVNNDIDVGLSSAQSTINTHVWADNNGNGIQDAGEPGLVGAIVNVYGGPDSPPGIVATGTTDSNGDISINVAPGSYALAITGRNGYARPTTQDVGNDDNVDSDIYDTAHPVTDQYVPARYSTKWFDIQPNETKNTVDAGFIKDPLLTVAVAKGVWLDSNKDGVKNDNEAGVEGVTVTLHSSDGNTYETTTNANGDYSFNPISAYQAFAISFSNIPSGKQFTTPNVGEILVPRAGFVDVATDSDVLDSTGRTFIANIEFRSPDIDSGLPSTYDKVSAGLVDIIGTPQPVV